MTTAIDQVAEVEREAREALEAAADEAGLEAWRTRVLGRSGTLTGILRGLGALPAEERREVGQAANLAKQALEAALEARRDALRAAAREAATRDAIDVTLPGRPVRRGRLHPVTRTLQEITRIFERMGFQAV